MAQNNIDYKTTVEYYKKRGYTINSGIDTLVGSLKLSENGKNLLKTNFQQFVVNSNVEYKEYKDYLIYVDYSKDIYAYIINYHIQDDEVGFPAFQIYINNEISKITYYGLFFRRCYLHNLDPLDIVKKYLDYRFPSIDIGIDYRMRYDYYIDIFGIAPSSLMRHLKRNNKKAFVNRSGIVFTNKGIKNTYYVGAKGSKYSFTRVYHKRKDINLPKKNKVMFYKDYPKNVTRIELQFGSSFIPGDYNLKQIQSKINSYMGFKSTFKGNYYVRNRSNQYILDKQRYKTRWINMTGKILNNGIEPSVKELEEIEKKTNGKYKIILRKNLFRN